MSARYSLVHFSPDPAIGARIPIAALVDRDGSVHLAPAYALPEAKCVGGMAAATLLPWLLNDLLECRRLDRLPAGLGPHVQLGPIFDVPAHVADPVKWVSTHVLPRGQAVNRTHAKVEQLATVGYRFLTQWRVAGLVKKRFQPADHWQDSRFASLAPVTHWVQGRDSLLLMEPVALTGRKAEASLKTIATRLSAYRWQLRETDSAKTKLVAYILPSDKQDSRREFKSALQSSCHRVFDCGAISERQQFIEKIEAVGWSGMERQ